MPVTVSLDMTIPHPTVNYANVKPGVTIGPLDPDAPAEELERQIQASIDLAVQVFERIDNGMETVLSRLLAPETASPTGNVRETLDGVRAQMSAIVERLRGYNLAQLIERVEALETGDQPEHTAGDTA